MSLKFAFPMSSTDGYSQFESGNGIPLLLVIDLSMQDIDSLCHLKFLHPDNQSVSFEVDVFVGIDMDMCEYEAHLKQSEIHYHSFTPIDLLDAALATTTMYASPSLPTGITRAKVSCNQVNLHVNDRVMWLTSTIRMGGETIHFRSCSKSLSDLSRLFKAYFGGKAGTTKKRDECKDF
ncbi:MAG: hypothetical protein CBB95_17680 [Alteromonas sp. TMED35]|nr:MAG: hypothetical protein CBB95_17680 [Alteromonas sp. TMED35]